MDHLSTRSIVVLGSPIVSMEWPASTVTERTDQALIIAIVEASLPVFFIYMSGLNRRWLKIKILYEDEFINSSLWKPKIADKMSINVLLWFELNLDPTNWAEFERKWYHCV